MGDYRRRSESVKAMQFSGRDNAFDLITWVAEHKGKTLYDMGGPSKLERMLVESSSGEFVPAYVNDWVVLHADGRFDVSHPFFFENTYEEEINHMVVTYKTFKVDPDLEALDEEEDPGYEEWLAKQKEDDLWWEENRKKMFFYAVLGFILLPPALVYDWYVRRKAAREETSDEN